MRPRRHANETQNGRATRVRRKISLLIVGHFHSGDPYRQVGALFPTTWRSLRIEVTCRIRSTMIVPVNNGHPNGGHNYEPHLLHVRKADRQNNSGLLFDSSTMEVSSYTRVRPTKMKGYQIPCISHVSLATWLTSNMTVCALLTRLQLAFIMLILFA
jgi:hypothetical protein